MNDLVTRQSVLTMLQKIENAVEDGDGFQFNEWVEYIKDIPSAEKTTINPTKTTITDTDLISRAEAVECCFNGWNKDFNEIAEDIKKLPTYPAEQTENPTKDIYSAIEYWKSVDEDNNMVKWLTELQEYREAEREKAEQTYDWCKGCKEYDTENHCCHRYSSFIRESLQENINAVLEDIKAEIIDEQNNWIKGADAEWHECRRILQILDNHISGKGNE